MLIIIVQYVTYINQNYIEIVLKMEIFKNNN